MVRYALLAWRCAPRIQSSLRFGLPGRCLLLGAFCWLAIAAPALAANPTKATSSRAARDEAIRSIPMDKLDAQGRDQVQNVLKHISVYRRLPVQVIRAEPSLYQFFLEHPDVTVQMWRSMGLTELQVERTGENRFRINDGQGTTGDSHFLYRSHDTLVVYTKGVYDGPMFPKAVQGHVVMLLKTGFVREPSGEILVTSRLDTFIRMDNVGVDLIAKTFNPLVGRIIDDNFIESMKFVGNFSQKAAANPPAMQALAERVQNVRQQDQDELLQIVADIGAKGRAGQRGGDVASRERGGSAETPAGQPKRMR